MQWTLHAPPRNTAMRSRRTEEIAGVDQEQPTELNARSQGAVQWTLMHAPTRNTHPATRVPAVRVEYIARADQEHPTMRRRRAKEIVPTRELKRNTRSEGFVQKKSHAPTRNIQTSQTRRVQVPCRGIARVNQERPT